MRAVIGLPIAVKLDQIVNSTLQSVALQHQQMLAQWGGTIDHSNSSRDGNYSWERYKEDEITKISSENGLSLSKKFNIFISHAWKDKNLSVFKEIENALKHDYSVWVDVKGIDYGEPIREKLVQAIQNSDIVIVLWSQAADQSEDVQFEIKTAVDLKKRIIPCLISNYDLENSPNLRGRKYIDFFHNAKGIDGATLGLIKLKNLLLRLLSDDPKYASVAGQIDSLNGLLEELEHVEYRMKQEYSGNEHGNSFIQALMEAGTKAVKGGEGGDSHKQKLAKLFERIQEISAQYPNPDEDLKRCRLTIQAIDEIDPSGEEIKMQVLKNALSMKIG